MPCGRSSIIVFVAALTVASFINSPICNKDYQEWIDIASGSTMILNGGGSMVTDSFSSKGRLNNTTTIPVDIGLDALMEHNYPLKPISKVLPHRLYIIYGLESSGTTFMSKTIASALGIQENPRNDIFETKDHQTHVHHISLPWGLVPRGHWGFQERFIEPLPTVPVFYPNICRVGSVGRGPPQLQLPPEECRDIMRDPVLTQPYRYFVNMTANILWYRERGVRVYPIMVVRDPLLHFRGIIKQHCSNVTAAYQQYEQGREIMMETIEKGLKPIILSYETMLTLQKSYLRRLYHQLGIQSDYMPGFRNGNTKYVSPNDKPRPHVETQLMGEDAPPPPRKVFRTDPLRPPASLWDRPYPRGTTNRADQIPRLSSIIETDIHTRQVPGIPRLKGTIKRPNPGFFRSAGMKIHAGPQKTGLSGSKIRVGRPNVPPIRARTNTVAN